MYVAVPRVHSVSKGEEFLDLKQLPISVAILHLTALCVGRNVCVCGPKRVCVRCIPLCRVLCG